MFASANMHAWGGGVGGVYTTVCFCEHACVGGRSGRRVYYCLLLRTCMRGGEEWVACILLFASANMHAWGGGVGGVYTTVCFCEHACMHAWGGGVGGVYTTVCFCEHACMHAWGGGVGGVYTTGSQTIQYLADLEKTDFCDSQTIMQAKIIEG